ncbi:unnamed protein product [Penicillium nalgiovense]|nr:unnamed protein product [Penicillium nalgiovense]
MFVIQRQLETHAFCFLQQWLLSESLAAISKCISGFKGSKSLCRIQEFVNTALSGSDQLTAQLKQNAHLQICLCEAHPDYLVRRLILLPEAVRRVTQSSEDDFVSEVEQFLRAEFKST